MTAPVTISESTAGPNRAASSVESVLAIIGCATDGDIASPVAARNERQPADTFDSGPLVDFARIIIGEGRQPAVLVRATTATPGGYGTLDDDLFDGTAVPAAGDAVPDNAYEGYFLFATGGDLGTSGITYYTSLDNGNSLSPIQALGTDTSILTSTGNVELTFDVPEAALVAYVADIRTQVLAHFAMGAGTHNAADTTSGVGIGGAPTTRATAIARINEIRAALLLHADDSPTVHNSDDTTSFATMPVAATDGVSAVVLALAIAAAYAVHAANVTAHDAADTTNDVTATAPTTGTIVAGDIIRLPTTAPLFDDDGLAAALDSLPFYQGQKAGGICIAGALTTSDMWGALINGLDALEAQQRPCSALVEWRVPDEDETESEYRAAFEAFRSGLARDNRVSWYTGGCRYYPTEVRQTLQQHFRTCLALAAARHVSLRYEQSPALVDPVGRSLSATPSTYGGPLRGVRIYDDNFAPIGHDESSDPGLSDLLSVTTRSYPQEGGAAFLTEPLTFRPENDTVYLMPIRRIANVCKRLIYFRLTRLIQTLLLRAPGTTEMSEAEANKINKLVLAELRAELKGRVTGVTFDVDVPGSDISVPSPRVLWNASVTTGGYVAGFDGVLSINR
jgi:hypothetical protein